MPRIRLRVCVSSACDSCAARSVEQLLLARQPFEDTDISRCSSRTGHASQICSCSCSVNRWTASCAVPCDNARGFEFFTLDAAALRDTPSANHPDRADRAQQPQNGARLIPLVRAAHRDSHLHCLHAVFALALERPRPARVNDLSGDIRDGINRRRSVRLRDAEEETTDCRAGCVRRTSKVNTPPAIADMNQGANRDRAKYLTKDMPRWFLPWSLVRHH